MAMRNTLCYDACSTLPTMSSPSSVPIMRTLICSVNDHCWFTTPTAFSDRTTD